MVYLFSVRSFLILELSIFFFSFFIISLAFAHGVAVSFVADGSETRVDDALKGENPHYLFFQVIHCFSFGSVTDARYSC